MNGFGRKRDEVEKKGVDCGGGREWKLMGFECVDNRFVEVCDERCDKEE